MMKLKFTHEGVGSDDDVWNDMTYQEGDIPPELGGFDMTDEDDDGFDNVIKDLIHTDE